MFIVMKIQDFKFEESPDNILHLPFPVKIEPGKMIGFVPVYETKEDALSDFPGAVIAEVVLVKGE
jgi:hypothetical protein